MTLGERVAPLTVAYRPTSFADVVGQRVTRAVLSALLASGELPGAILLAGPTGTGKTTLGRICAAEMGGDVSEAHGATMAVSDMESLNRWFRSRTGVEPKVTIIDEAHTLSPDAADALLDLLEYLPERSMVILITTEPHRVPLTLRNRSMVFSLTALDPAHIVMHLSHVANEEGIEVDAEVLIRIADRSGGSMRSALMDLDLARRVGALTTETFEKLHGEHDFGGKILTEALRGNLGEALELWRRSWYESGDLAGVAEQMISALTEVFRRRGVDPSYQAPLGDAELLQFAQLLWRLPRRPERHEMELALVLMCEAAGASPAPAHSSQPEPLDMEELRTMVAAKEEPDA